MSTILSIKENSVFMIDGTNLMHRHFYVNKDLATSDGIPTGAVYGTIKTLMNFAKNYRPLQMFICLDLHRKNFRNDLYAEYKNNRKPTDPRLKEQFPLLEEFCQAAGLPCIKKEDFEADDLIGSLCFHASDYNFYPYAVSGDKDLFQLLAKNIEVIYVSNKGPVLFNEQKLTEKYDGLKPEQFLDLKALQGDASDNIPGVPGIGEKTAIKLLKSYGSLDSIYQHLSELKGKQKENLENFKDQAYLSKELATIQCDMDLDYNQYFEMEMEEGYQFDSADAKEFFRRLEMKSFLQ